MDTFVLSIGLNVGTMEPPRQLADSLRLVDVNLGAPLAVAMGRGEWDGVPERFVQILVLAHQEIVARRVREIAQALHQDAIAVTFPGVASWTLIHADGRIEAGGMHRDFPIIVDVPAEE